MRGTARRTFQDIGYNCVPEFGEEWNELTFIVDTSQKVGVVQFYYLIREEGE